MEKADFLKAFEVGDIITLPSSLFYVDYITIHKLAHFNFFGMTPEGRVEIFSYEKDWKKYRIQSKLF